MKTKNKMDDFILVRRKDVADAIKKQCLAHYRILFLTFVVSAKKIELTITTKDVCEILQIDFETFERLRGRLKITNERYGDLRLYDMADMIRLAELLTRDKRHRQLCLVPTAMQKPAQP